MIQKDTFTPVFTVALLTIASTWKQTKCPLTEEWIKKMGYTYTMKYCAVLSHSVTSDTLRPQGLQPARLLCPWDSPGKNTGVAAISFSRESSDPGIELVSPALQANSLPSEPPGKPQVLRALHDFSS